MGNILQTLRPAHLVKLALSLLLTLSIVAFAAPRPALAVTCERTYIVKEGDSTPRIAHLFGLKWREIAKENKLKYPYNLQVGQVLCIPEGGKTFISGKLDTNPRAKVSVTVLKDQLFLTASSFSVRSTFIVKVRNGPFGRGGWYKVGVLKAKSGQVYNRTYTLPKNISRELYVTVCLKDATTDERMCNTVIHQ